MTDAGARPVTHATFTVERRYAASVRAVFGAFSDASARGRWMAGGAEHALDFRVGGTEAVAGADGEGRALLFEARYLDIVPGERIVTSSTMRSDGELSTASVTSIAFRADGDATVVTLTDSGAYVDGYERPEWREAGTTTQLDALAEELTRKA